MQRGTRRTIARSALLGGGALAAVLVAGCQGNVTGSGSAGGSIATSEAPVTVTSTAATPPVIATDTGTGTVVPAPVTPPAAGGGGAAAPAAPAGTAECKAGDLKLGVAGGQGAAGHTIVSLTFTNVSGHTCAMKGWPGVSYVTGDSGTQVGAPARRTGSMGPQVNLAPGHVASAQVQVTDTGVYGGGCTPTSVRGFRVYAPDDTASMFVARAGTGCANPAKIDIEVQTVKPGTGGA